MTTASRRLMLGQVWINSNTCLEMCKLLRFITRKELDHSHCMHYISTNPNCHTCCQLSRSFKTSNLCKWVHCEMNTNWTQSTLSTYHWNHQRFHLPVGRLAHYTRLSHQPAPNQNVQVWRGRLLGEWRHLWAYYQRHLLLDGWFVLYACQRYVPLRHMLGGHKSARYDKYRYICRLDYYLKELVLLVCISEYVFSLHDKLYESILTMSIHIITNFVVIYIRRRRIIIDDPDVKFFILIMMYYNAMDWVSVGWLVALSGARPLHQCLVSYTSTFFHFLDTIVLFYAFTGDFFVFLSRWQTNLLAQPGGC